MKILAGAICLLIAGATGCGGDDSGDGPGPGSSSGGSSSTTGGSERTGVTECGIQQCSAGQHCDNLICQNGCLSDDNCAANQTCAKEGGENIGSCQNTTTTAPGKDCDAFVTLCSNCGESPGNCQSICDYESNACIECVLNTGGCDAYFDCDACE
jgi:hypothetical protein